MLPLDLLRTKISRGRIAPLFCSLDFGNGSDYELANKLIIHFENTHKNCNTKGNLLEKIDLLESEYDYKLVRGLFTLLERRSVFESNDMWATPEEPAAPSMSGDSAEKQSTDYSKTNIQVEGVDEADIVKTDGEYIYVASQNNLTIIKAYTPHDFGISVRVISSEQIFFVKSKSIF